MTVKVIDLEDTTNMKVLSGHTKAVRRVSWHPSSTILVRSQLFRILEVTERISDYVRRGREIDSMGCFGRRTKATESN